MSNIPLTIVTFTGPSASLTDGADDGAHSRVSRGGGREGRSKGGRRRRRIFSGRKPGRAKIDDLSDVLLVEILCRLPCNKLIFQCKLVSKSWYNLISAPYFVRRYLCLQRQMQKPVLKTLVFFEITKPISLITTSDHPVFKAAASNFTPVDFVALTGYAITGSLFLAGFGTVTFSPNL
ncbi:hypothetical protein ACLB2K_012682 [Fragaria x ananassa]